MKLAQFLANVVPDPVPEAYVVPSENGLKLGPLTLGAIAHGLQLQASTVADVVTTVITFMLTRGVPADEFCAFNRAWRHCISRQMSPQEALRASLDASS